MVEKILRNSGFDVVGDIPWGAHICLFYENIVDLIDAHARYFISGIEENELCFWAYSDPVTLNDAVDGLSEKIPRFQKLLEAGKIELVSAYDWYLRDGQFDKERVAAAWYAKLDTALARGFSGVRASGNAFWFDRPLWNRFRDYECEVEEALKGHKTLALCTYPLRMAAATDLLDVIRNHSLAVAMSGERWEFLEVRDAASVRQSANQACRRGTGKAPISNSQELLTPREQTTLDRIVMGESTKEVARALDISPRTVEFHRNNIMRKVGARNIAELLTTVLGMREAS